MSVRFLLIMLTLVAIKCSVNAQTFPEKNYPRNYFRWPVEAAIGIAANFGELRPNHYHMGLDCRTDQKENVAVLAAASGYVAKIKIEPFGFGRCIYINHPNGLTTLYAHLNAFEPALEKYVKEQQYLLKQWRIFIDVPPGLFPVNKGDYIAGSGNTGGSQGPHLHFEIRETSTDKNLNPLLFDLPMADEIPPYVLRLAVYDRTKSTYNQSPKIYPLKKVNGIYLPLAGTIPAPSDKISFAITAYDRYTGSTNQNGIYGGAVFADDKRISSFEMDRISYDDTRYLNAHIDYRLRSSGGSWLQHLSPLPGNSNGIYKTDETKGILSLNGAAHDIKIIVADANHNETEIGFKVTPAPPVPAVGSAPPTQQFVPNYVNVFESERCWFYLPDNAIYDTVNFMYKEVATAAGTVFQLGTATYPVHTYFTVYLKSQVVPEDTGKLVMKRSYGAKEDYKKAVYRGGWSGAAFREFGNFQLLTDKTPPNVSTTLRDGMNVSKLSRLVFSVTDNTEEIENFTALLDGKWLRFTNDKGRNFIYYFDELCLPGTHVLRISATDQVGNTTEKTYNFTR